MARAAGFDNVSLDLMLWLPQQSVPDWLSSVDALIDDFYTQQREIVRRLVADGINGSGDGLQTWLAQRTGSGSRVPGILADITRTASPDIAMLTVASRQIRALVA